MTQTTQPRTCATISEEGKNLTITVIEEENVELLLSLCDSLDELQEKLDRLSQIIGVKITEQNFYQEG